MNQLVLIDPILTFGENEHPFCESGFTIIKKRVLCLLDTGFTLGFTFSKSSLGKFGFANGYIISMLLGNGIPVKGIAFSVELIVRQSQQDTLLGSTSVVFMEKNGEPLIGVETLRLMSPLLIDWQNRLVESSVLKNIPVS